MTAINKIINSSNFKTWIIGIFFAVSVAIWGYFAFKHHFYVSTDDAYVNANILQVAPRVGGKINAIYVDNNQYVRKGQTLFMIDSEPLQLAVNSAKAELNFCLAELDQATQTKNRVLALVKKKFLSPQDGDNATANFKTATAKVERAKTQLAQAELNLSYSVLRAENSGWITNFSLRAGDIVAPNQPLFAIVNDQEFWVDANFKETEMQSIKPGQSAEIISDMYPKHQFKGQVMSISSGTGNAFSLLPAENATGNWVKVTQRVPVRIRVLNANKAFPLRVGTSAFITINIKS